MTSIEGLTDQGFDALVPEPHSDLITEFIENEAVAWSGLRSYPVLLDPVAAIVYQLIDGNVSVGELVEDVHEALGVPESIARTRLRRVMQQFEDGGLLSTSRNETTPDDEYALFPGPQNP